MGFLFLYPILRVMQKQQFDNIDQFLDFLPEEEYELTCYLMDLIQTVLPDVRMKLSYNVPYFYGKTRICFVWPASIGWSGFKGNGVKLGFCQGSQILNSEGYLEDKDLKQIRSKIYQSIYEVPEELIKDFLFEAWEINHQGNKKK